MASHPSAMPMPGSSFVTPQAWRVPSEGEIPMERHTTPENIKKFFDPTTYSKPTTVIGPQKIQLPPMERHTTPENIRKFFDPATYSKPTTLILSPPCSTWVQKRAAPPAAAAVHPAAKARLDKHDLIEKFKLAATLNGYSWDEVCESWL